MPSSGDSTIRTGRIYDYLRGRRSLHKVQTTLGGTELKNSNFILQ